MSEGTSFNTGLHAQILEHMAEGIVLARLKDRTIVYANPSLKRLFSYVTGEVIGRQLDLLLTGSEVATGNFPNDMLDTVRTGEPWTGEVGHARKDGSRFWSLINASQFHHDEHGPLLVMVLQDITPQKLARMELEQSRQLQHRAQRLAMIGHWQLDLKTGQLIFGTDELYQIFELPKGAPLEDFDKTVHPEDRESVGKMMQKTLASGGVYDSTYRLVTRNGNRKWVHAIGEGVFNERGELKELAGSVQDITAFRLVEEELLKMQKLKSLGILAGGIAHDFNNIHTLLFGNIALARSKLAENEPGHAELGIAEKALQRARSLSNQLLTFAKGGDPVKRSLELDKLIAEVVRFDLAGSRVRFELEAQVDLWPVDADPGQMEQVFTNLAINAYQAMPLGGVLRIALDNVELSSTNELNLNEGRYVRVKVIDNGTGIAEEHLFQIFDPYFTTKESGTGLGLATAYSIVKRHGGHIEVSSQRGKGTTFLLYLPAARQAAVAVSGIESANDSDIPRTGRILVMDDEVELCALVQRILKLDGYEVDTAYNGSEAIAKYKQAMSQRRPYDCVIMDLTIPGEIGGKEVVVEILRLHPSAKAIVSSGYAADPVLANFRRYGFCGVIPKPYTPNNMRKVVAEIVNGGPRR